MAYGIGFATLLLGSAVPGVSRDRYIYTYMYNISKLVGFNFSWSTAIKQLSYGSNIFSQIAAEARFFQPSAQVGPGNVLSTLTSKCVRGPRGPMKRADVGWT